MGGGNRNDSTMDHVIDLERGRGKNKNSVTAARQHNEERELNQTFMSSLVLQTHEAEILSKTFMCEICFEPKPPKESFNIQGCSHSYCSDCMVKYVASKIQENITSIRCPESKCHGVLEPEFCVSILPREVFDRWCNALCETLILGSQKFYCPFKDCSGLLMDEGGEVVKEAECPHCRRLFCAQCKVPWHSEIGCEEFQKLNADERGRDDLLAMQLAQKNKWKRCPKCNFYVERIDGCLFIKCRCGHGFCYKCGGAMESSNHHCKNCNRTW